jgi:isocitrate dehydrogenase
LDEDKSPTRRIGGIDNRGSHFYLALFWAEALAAQSDDAELKLSFSALASTLQSAEDQVIQELISVQGAAADIGAYYRPDAKKAENIMRPSATLNQILAN